jgi:hypothetical protein
MGTRQTGQGAVSGVGKQVFAQSLLAPAAGEDGAELREEMELSESVMRVAREGREDGRLVWSVSTSIALAIRRI